MTLDAFAEERFGNTASALAGSLTDLARDIDLADPSDPAAFLADMRTCGQELARVTRDYAELVTNYAATLATGNPHA